MIEWEVVDTHLRVVDTDNAELIVRGDDLRVEDTNAELPRPVDETVETTASKLRFPHAVVYAFSLDGGTPHELDPSGEPLSLPPGEYLLDVDTEIKTYLQLSGALRIERTADFSSVVVSLPEPKPVVLGFRSRHEFPAGTITVPDSPSGIARALTYLSTAQKTTSPDRTYPTLRGHPPLIERGESFSVPDHIESAVMETKIELVVPQTYESTYILAPLAYYLQASVEPDDVDQPTLRLPSQDVERELPAVPDLERSVARLLQKTFFLDSLVRNAGPYGTSLSELGLVDALGLDIESLYNAAPDARLARYLDIPFDALEHRLPEWHLATYVEPSATMVETVPFLLDRLSLCYLPRTSELEGTELVERSLEDFYRGKRPLYPTKSTDADFTRTTDWRSNTGQVASVDIVKPELRSGRVHGWLADGVPIDVFKLAPEAYVNRLEYLKRGTDEISICVILNDPDMAGEHEDVSAIYRDRSEKLPISVTVEESQRTDALAQIFEAGHEFVHYIGHCEEDGLRCPDGYLSVSSLDRCATQVFFLNACGSFYEGMALIEKGAVAGGVTFTQVFNEHAIKVGSAFAKLLVHGFSIERALRLARRRIMMGKDYAVVGDGTHTLTQGEHYMPATATLEELDEDRYHLRLDCYSTQSTGSYYFPHTKGNNHAFLCGNESSFILDTDGLVTFLEEAETPVIYEGDVYWSRQLSSQFD